MPAFVQLIPIRSEPRTTNSPQDSDENSSISLPQLFANRAFSHAREHFGSAQCLCRLRGVSVSASGSTGKDACTAARQMAFDRDSAKLIERYQRYPQFLGIEITNVNQRAAMNDTMLHFEAESGATEDMDLLVASEAEVNAIGDIGNTPLHGAALMGNWQPRRSYLSLEQIQHLGMKQVNALRMWPISADMTNLRSF